MANPQIRWKLKGFRDIRKSPEMEALLEKVVQDMLDELGEGYEGDVEQGRTRLRAGVVTASQQAKLDNARNNALLKALAKARSDS